MTEVQQSFLKEMGFSTSPDQSRADVADHTFLRPDGSLRSRKKQPLRGPLHDSRPSNHNPEQGSQLTVRCKAGAKVETHPNTPPKRSLLPFYVQVVDARHIVADGYEFDQLTCVSRDQFIAIQLIYEEIHDTFNARVGRVDRVVSREKFQKIMTFIKILREKCIKSTTINFQFLEEIGNNPSLLNDEKNQWDDSWKFNVFRISANTSMVLTGSAVETYDDRAKYKRHFNLP